MNQQQHNTRSAIKSAAEAVLGKRLYMKLWKLAVQKPRDLVKEKAIQKKNEESILEYKELFDPKIFIETGTYRGDMVNRMKDRFEKIYSIELGDSLYERAVKRFSSQKHIKILHGDSAKVLPVLLKEIAEPALFWLDAHYSTGETVQADTFTPVEKELQTIMAHPIKHIILIDDARHFLGRDGYPTASAIKKLAESFGYGFDMQRDNFRIFPKK